MNAPASGPAARRVRLPILLCAALAAAVAFQAYYHRQPEAEGLLVLPADGEWNPAEPIEVRFDRPVAAEEAVGLDNQFGPIQFAPPLPGTFTWLSRRHGVFVPEPPPTRGAQYRLRLSPQLSGRGLYLDKLLRVESFHAAFEVPRFIDTNNLPPGLTLQVVFNELVIPSNTLPHIYFQSEYGPIISASTNEWEFHGPAVTSLTVTPEHRLPPGQNWSLVVSAGVRSKDGEYATERDTTARLGKIPPFGVRSLSAINTPHGGRRLSLEFNRPLDQGMTPGMSNRWVRVEPAPPDLEVESGQDRLVIHGAFALATPYRIRLAADLASEDGFQLGGVVITNTQFAPAPPRIYFPGVLGEQLSLRDRTYPFQAVNLSQVQVQVKSLDSSTLIHALRAFRSYQRSSYLNGEPNAGLDYNVVAGRTVFQDTLHMSAETDALTTLEVSWDEVFGRGHPGAAFLSARSDPRSEVLPSQVGCQALVQLTDLGMIWKHAGTQAVVAVFSCATGEPLAGAQVILASDENEWLVEATTGADGVAALPWPSNHEASFLLVKRDADLHAVPLSDWNSELQTYWYHLPWGETEPANRQISLFSDRAVYRPGDVFHLKAVARRHEDDRLLPWTAAGAVLRLEDSRTRVFFETNLSWSPFGSLAVTLPLPDRARGSYRAVVESDGQSAEHFFTVADVKPDAFKVELIVPERASALEPCRIPITAAYLSGAAVRKARVAWSVEVEEVRHFGGKLDEYRFGLTDYFEEGEEREPEHSASGEVKLGQDGKAVISFDPSGFLGRDRSLPRLATLRAEVTDLGQQTLSATAEFRVDPARFYLGLEGQESFPASTTPLELKALAVAPDGRNFPAPVQAQLVLSRVHWRTYAVRAAGGGLSYRNEPVREEIQRRSVTLAPGDNALPFAPLPAGEYAVEISATDSDGHAVRTSMKLEVTGEAQTRWNWRTRDRVRMQITPDRDHYQPGDAATILIKAPFTGQALVTVERDTIRRWFVTNITEQAQTISLPLSLEDAPNVFVSVFLWHGFKDSGASKPQPDFRAGYCQLEIDPAPFRLHPALALSSTNARPGDTVEVTASVADSEGRNASGIEVTLYAVDEGLLMLKGGENPDLLDFFHPHQSLGVSTFHTFDSFMPGDLDDMSFCEKGFVIGGGGKESERTRRNFIPCPLWEPALITDANGQVHARFTVPDNLTRYRIVAVAQDGGGRFGNASDELTINQPIMLEPALPNFARVGDEIVARAVVQNETDHASKFEVSLRLDHARAAAEGGTLHKFLDAPARSQVAVEFPVTMTEAGQATWTWSALDANEGTNGYKDVVQTKLNIQPMLPPMRLAQSLELQAPPGGALSADLLAILGPKLPASGNGRFGVQVAGSEAVAVGNLASELLHYPYGCVEQNSSSLLPWIVARGLPIPSVPAGEEESRAAIESGLSRYAAMQTGPGGLGYWAGDNVPMLWGSAYAGFVLVLARQNQVAVPNELLDPLLAYLETSLHHAKLGAPGADVPSACLASLALATAGRNVVSDLDRLYGWRSTLAAEDRSLLAAAYAASGANNLGEARTLLAMPVSTPSKSPGCFASPLRELAVRLYARVRAMPDDSSLAEAARQLFRLQQSTEYRSTQENAWTLLALAEYVRSSRNLTAPFQGVVTLQNQEHAFTIDRDHIFAAFSTTYSADAPLRLAHLASDAPRELFATVSAEFVPAEPPRSPVSQGFTLTRRYFVVLDDGSLHSTTNLTAGDRVLVELEVETGHAQTYVALVDALPSVLEPVNLDFKTRELTGQNLVTDEWACSHRELRFDRVAWFYNDMPAGRSTVRYLARVRSAGTALAPPARVEAMYHPDRFATTAAEKMTTASLP